MWVVTQPEPPRRRGRSPQKLLWHFGQNGGFLSLGTFAAAQNG
jgi:hypothetical protein